MSKIVLADIANLALLHATADALRRRGHSVDVIADSDALLRFLLVNEPDVLFVSYYRKGLSFLDVCSELEKQGRTLKAKVVLASLLKEDNSVGLPWEDSHFDGFLPMQLQVMYGDGTSAYYEWTIIAAIEQQLYRSCSKEKA